MGLSWSIYFSLVFFCILQFSLIQFRIPFYMLWWPMSLFVSGTNKIWAEVESLRNVYNAIICSLTPSIYSVNLFSSCFSTCQSRHITWGTCHLQSWSQRTALRQEFFQCREDNPVEYMKIISTQSIVLNMSALRPLRFGCTELFQSFFKKAFQCLQ